MQEREKKRHKTQLSAARLSPSRFLLSGFLAFWLFMGNRTSRWRDQTSPCSLSLCPTLCYFDCLSLSHISTLLFALSRPTTGRRPARRPRISLSRSRQPVDFPFAVTWPSTGVSIPSFMSCIFFPCTCTDRPGLACLVPCDRPLLVVLHLPIVPSVTLSLSLSGHGVTASRHRPDLPPEFPLFFPLFILPLFSVFFLVNSTSRQKLLVFSRSGCAGFTKFPMPARFFPPCLQSLLVFFPIILIIPFDMTRLRGFFFSFSLLAPVENPPSRKQPSTSRSTSLSLSLLTCCWLAIGIFQSLDSSCFYFHVRTPTIQRARP